MDDARALAGRLRAMAAEPWKHDGGSWPDPMREAADLIDRLAAPEGVGLTTTAHERDQWRYSANPFTVEDKERLLRDFNRVVASLLKSNMERQAAEAERDALKAALLATGLRMAAAEAEQINNSQPYPLQPKCQHCNDTGLVAIRSDTGIYARPGPVPCDARGYAEAPCWECSTYLGGFDGPTGAD